MAGGRPPKYNAEQHCKIAKKMCQLGATDNDIAEALGIATCTLYRWRNEHEEFRESLKVGKDKADDRVEMALYRRAVGYTHEAVKVFQFQGSEVIVPYTEIVQPDVTACIFWLKNRRPDQYRANPEDKIDVKDKERKTYNVTLSVKDASEDDA